MTFFFVRPKIGPVFSFSLLFLLVLSGCVSAPLPENPPPPPLPPRTILIDTPASKAVKALLLGQEKKALLLARTIRNKQERESLLNLIRQWSLDRQSDAIRSDFSDGHRAEALSLLLALREKSPGMYTNLLLEIPPGTLSWVLHHEIHTGQEQLAVRTMKLLQPFKRTSFLPTISLAYSHWGFRRFWQHRYHASLNLANQALNADPANKNAISLKKRVLAIRDTLVSRGLVAYRHQHLPKAIRLWEMALSIDPSNEDTKNYILKAEELLKKVRHLEGQVEQPTIQTQGGKK
ncbi:MAG: hypothetical protein M0Z25_03160 [Nitrospiraceae bacterium]|nr:hypothetical protein [Nitrospiraceae bacterium]